MINHIIDYLDVMLKHDVEKIALENILNAKLTQMVASRGVRFKQYSHSKPMPLSYYAFSFLPSGIGKDYMVSLIDDNIMPFVKTELAKNVDIYKQRIYDEEMSKALSVDAKEKKDIELRANELVKSVRSPNLNIGDATFTGLYAEAKQIRDMGFGCICFVINEYGDYLGNAAAGDANKREIAEKMKDISDGCFKPRLTGGDKDREEINDVAVCGILASDFAGMQEPKTNLLFKKLLDTGMGRRSFTYIPESFKPLSTKRDWQEREKAQMLVGEVSKALEQVYYSIPIGAIYEFNTIAKNLLANFEEHCIEEYNNLYMHDSTSAKEAAGATWKVMKYAVVLGALNEPNSTLIDGIYVKQAINFYDRIKHCLKIVLDSKEDTPEIKLEKFLTGKSNGDIITRTDVRNLKIHVGNFKEWYETAVEQVIDKLDFVFPWKGKGRADGLQIRR